MLLIKRAEVQYCTLLLRKKCLMRKKKEVLRDLHAFLPSLAVALHHVTLFHVHDADERRLRQRRAQHAQRKDLLCCRYDDRM